MKPIRVALCADFPEEGWPSMDRVAGMLLDHLRRLHAGAIDVTPVVPPFVRRATMIGARLGGSRFTVDRMLNRYWDYPRHVGRLGDDFDVFHVIDHSYSQLIHRLPSHRTVVTCHDLDTFRSILHPEDEPRSQPFRAMARHVLEGMRRAARVTCDTTVIKQELVGRALIPPARLVVAPVGAGEVYSSQPDPESDRAAERLVAAPPGACEILHVGSTIPRKRIDRLLRICGALVGEVPSLHLVRVGGAFSSEQGRLVEAAGLEGRISVVDFVDDRTLAAIYRRAALVLLPSDREGFGLPMVEAMASGTPVVASDLPVLREVGGLAAEYCRLDSIEPWVQRVLELLNERQHAPSLWGARRNAAIERAKRFTWPAFAARLARVYREVATEAEPMLARTPA
jgi:glycosyltransferase involved in cell wall biosynthesis